MSRHHVTSASRLIFPSKQTFISAVLHVRLVPLAEVGDRMFTQAAQLAGLHSGRASSISIRDIE